MQHDGYPTIEQFKDWRAVVSVTTRKGEIVENPQPGQKAVGPYLLKAPSNAITGLTAVSDADHIDAQTAWAIRKAHVDTLGDVDLLFAVVPDTPELHQLLADADWVIFSDKVTTPPAADANGK